MRKLFLIFFLFCFAGCASDRAMYYYSAPTNLPNVRTEMKTPGFWIGRLTAPDQVIMTADEINRFNREIIRKKYRGDISVFPATYTGREMSDSLRQRFYGMVSAGYFTQYGRKADQKFFIRIKGNMEINNLPDSLNVRYAIVARNSDQRFLPTQDKLTAKPLDIDFDELQENSLDINTPVAVLWQSVDRIWSYVIGPSSPGWVLTENLAFCGQEEMKRMRTPDFVVITSAKADIYLDQQRTRFYSFVRMGTRFELKNISQEVVEISLPIRDETGHIKIVSGYIRAKDLHRGYRPYTPRVIIEQAFEMLNTPYGWGGANGEQDCSQFLQEVFATAGIEIPRDSSVQANIGISLYEFKENEIEAARRDQVRANARAGLSILYMNGHIMLYLGESEGSPYAIHDTWAYREKIASKDTPRRINKVTVSDLSLGQGSGKGSLLLRLKQIRIYNVR
ncbi:MAG: SH3 domain-containing protein [Candidatus Omnitrophica bacterium]|nr:SH3 domain-containing protein [Candidatus Omnitrophota bacterium]